MRPWLRRALVVIVVLGGAAAGALFGTRTGRALIASTDAFVPLASDSRVRYEPGARAHAEAIARLLPASVAQVEQAQVHAFTEGIEVVVCATQERFNRHVPSGTIARGATFLGRVFLSPRVFTTQTHEAILVHELSHLHLQQHLGAVGYVQEVPAWFQEGLAVYVSGGGGAESVEPEAARRAVIAGRTFVPEDTGSLLVPKTARVHGLPHHLFYRQSGLFVAYLHDRDEAAFQAFLRALQAGASFKEAFARMGGSVSSLWAQFVQEIKADVSPRDP